jgi:hypothetical protein
VEQDASEGLQDVVLASDALAQDVEQAAVQALAYAVLASDAADLASLLPDAGLDLQEPVVRVYPDASAP